MYRVVFLGWIYILNRCVKFHFIVFFIVNLDEQISLQIHWASVYYTSCKINSLAIHVTVYSVWPYTNF